MASFTKNKLFLAGGICPFPANSGGATRFYNTIKHLSNYFDIYLLLFKPNNYSLKKSDINFLKKHTIYFETIDINNYQNQNTFFSSNTPYWFSPWYQPDALLATSRIINTNAIKIAQIEFTQIAYLINAIPITIYTIFVSHDICTVSFRRRLSEITNWKTYFVHFVRYLEIYYYEKYYLHQFKKIVTMSTTDQRKFKTLFNIKNSLCVPTGIESIAFLDKILPSSQLKICLFGSFNHPPNRFAFSYFLKNIAPLLNDQKIDYKLILVGSNSASDVLAITSQYPPQITTKIINLGFVKKTIDVFNQIDCLFAPIFSGSGTRVKIIESLSYGVPVISSPIGAEGIEINNPLLTIAYTPQEYVNATKKLSSIYNSNNLISLKKFLTPFLWSNIFKDYYNHLYHLLKWKNFK
jgi:glycosyltransferase involved in cell wall biosynthesis